MRKLLPALRSFTPVFLTGGFLAISMTTPAPAAPPAAPAAVAPAEAVEKDVPTYDLLEASRKGLVSVSAEGSGDGRMTISVKNRTKKQLRVVLPPGLIASGASGQFGGMGGGMGGMGGGMGGMGGGMGGMGGGGMMGGMGGGGMGGGGMGGMGGGMGGGGMTGGAGAGGMGGAMGGMGQARTMPAQQGMMMLAMLIMNLIGDKDSWDTRSMMAGMGGMGGGMGGMGGGMGGMGGGGMGGMGGGFRSVPPAGRPSATLKPNQIRHLPTRVASLSAPNPDDPASEVVMPSKGERLRIGDISDRAGDPKVATALTRLANDQAPDTVATLVMWHVAGGLNWDAIAAKSKGFALPHELSLARSFVEQLDALPNDKNGALLYEVTGSAGTGDALSASLAEVLKGRTMLGLKPASGVPAAPQGPAVACKVVVGGTEGKPEATVYVATTDSTGAKWDPAGKFELPVSLKDGRPDAVKFADALAEGLLSRLVRVQVSKSKAGMDKGKAIYNLKIDNASALVLNGLAILGVGEGKEEQAPKVLSGICVSPHRSMTVPATADVVNQLGLRKGVRVIAADLSGL